MSLKLLLDEDTQANDLIGLLKAAGHDVETTTTLGLNDEDDDIVLQHAQAQDRIVLTYNCNDYRALNDAGAPHVGILGVYKNNNKMSDMSHGDIVNAIANLEASRWDFAGQFVALNLWHFAPPAP